MAHALRLARRGLYGTSPNPRVGCVLVRAGRVVGEGWHERAGSPHAEIHALNQAGAAARGATAYLNLEPCAHTGRTPPCVQALIAAGISRAVISMTDPNPLVSGRGRAALEAGGVTTEVGLLAAEAESLNAGFVKRMVSGLPWVRCKMAVSLDGKIAAADGDGKWISGEDSRADVQRLRAQSCAILTGIGTVLADDPRLNVRLESVERQPLRAVFDRRLRFPPQAAMLAQPGRCLVLTLAGNRMAPARAALEQAGAEVVIVDGPEESFALSALRHLASAEQVNELLLEAGPRLAGAMLAQGLVDELIFYQAPFLLGDRGADAFHLPGVRTLADAIPLKLIEMRRIGGDWRLRFRRSTDKP